MALLVQEDAGKLSLIEDIQKGLLGLTSHLSQSQSFCYCSHEAALDHVHNQHHLGSIAYFTWNKTQHWTFLQNRCSSLAPPPHAVLTLLHFWSQTLHTFSLQALENLAVSHALEQWEKLKYHLKIKSTTDSPKWDNVQKRKLSLKALKLAEFQRSRLVSHAACGDRKQPVPLVSSLQRWYICLSDSLLNIPVLALTKNLLSGPWCFSYLEKKRSSPSLGNSYCSPHINPCHQLPGSQASHHLIAADFLRLVLPKSDHPGTLSPGKIVSLVSSAQTAGIEHCLRTEF